MYYHLYAYTHDDFHGVLDVAHVETYEFRDVAEQAKKVNEQCYADDGILFSILREHPTPAANVTFFDMMQRYSK